MLIINGSPRKNGNTATILSEAEKLASEGGYAIEWIDLLDKDIQACHGCLQCKKTGSCALDDDMKEIYPKIMDADIVLMGSPVYFSDCTGLFKTFFDRWYAFLSYSDRKGVLYDSRMDSYKKVDFIFPCGNPEGHILYHSITIKFASLMCNLFGLLDVSSSIIPRKKNEEDILKSPQTGEFLDILRSQL